MVEAMNWGWQLWELVEWVVGRVAVWDWKW